MHTNPPTKQRQARFSAARALVEGMGSVLELFAPIPEPRTTAQEDSGQQLSEIWTEVGDLLRDSIETVRYEQDHSSH